MDNAKTYKRLTKNMAQLISLVKMYDYGHPIVKDKMASAYNEVSGFFKENKRSIIFAKSIDILVINGEKIEPQDRLMAKFISDFVSLDIGSMELEPGLSKEEFELFVHVMCHTEHISGVEKLKKILSEKGASHIIARAATFKIVQENEDVVKRGDFIKVEDLPPETVKKFSKDFAEGKVSEKLKNADKGYKMAAHNPAFLAGLALDLTKEKNSPEDLDRMLWLLADYLIDEIDTSKEEDMNRAVLNEIKEKLLSKLREKIEKKTMAQRVEKTYAVINTSLQLKGLLALYKKHKKELESSVNKIKEIVKGLPTDSQLYRKTIKDLAEIGPVSIDEKTFK